MAAMTLAAEKALVLFSGGQDSATCLAWAVRTFAHVETIGFDYGQRHKVELDVRHQFAAALPSAMPEASTKLGVDHRLDLSLVPQLGETAMTADRTIEMAANGLPTTFVPGRNLLFFTAAAALGYRRGIRHLVGGMCETDFSGYPDCRDDTLKALQAALSLGLDSRVTIHTPLMWRDKAATWALAHELGGERLVALMRTETHTCYVGDRSQLHDWGYGCGTCPACELRANGWAKWRQSKDI
jgi:7-cyano-7-deazaguanine synthase